MAIVLEAYNSVCLRFCQDLELNWSVTLGVKRVSLVDTCEEEVPVRLGER